MAGHAWAAAKQQPPHGYRRGPGRKGSLWPAIHPAVQSCLEALLLGASTGITDGPQETEQTKIASSFLVPGELAGCGGGQEPQELASSGLAVDSWLSRLGWGQPKVAASPLAASGTHWTQTGHPPRARLLAPMPVHRLYLPRPIGIHSLRFTPHVKHSKNSFLAPTLARPLTES